MGSFSAVTFLMLVLLTTTWAERPAGSFTWYSTIGELKNLTVLDTGLLDDLLKRAKQSNMQLLKIKDQIDWMKKSRRVILHEIAKSSTTPSHSAVNSLLSEDWNKLRNVSRFAMNSNFGERFSKQRERFPDEEDLNSVLEALLELQATYKLNASDLAEGYILGKDSGKRISMSSCGYLVMRSCEKSTMLCKQWTNVLLGRMDAGELSEYTRDDVHQMLQELIVAEDFKNLCASALNEKVPSNHLQCHMWTNYEHPWLILQPVAMEILSKSPPIARFFNVISDKDIEFLKLLSIPKLGAAQTSEEETSFTVDSYRVAHNCWLSKKNNSVLQRIDRLVSAITGLQVAGSSEQLQIANYGIAGHYRAHTDQMDYDEKREWKTSNRKATFMFYLSDVESGGATAFLYPKIAVKPIKGSAVFWHNLLPSGIGDERTMHGSCSVLLGDKWVANKWIRETKKEVCKLSEYIGRIH